MHTTSILPVGFKAYTLVDYFPAAHAVYYGKDFEVAFRSEAECREWIGTQSRLPESFTVVPLFLSPKISDKERNALQDAAHRLDYSDGVNCDTVLAVELRALAERLA